MTEEETYDKIFEILEEPQTIFKIEAQGDFEDYHHFVFSMMTSLGYISLSFKALYGLPSIPILVYSSENSRIILLDELKNEMIFNEVLGRSY